MEKKKNYGTLMIGTILLIASIIFTVTAYHTSYQKSLTPGDVLDQAEKLKYQRPYAYGLTAVFVSIMLAIKGLYNALIGMNVSKSNSKRLAQAGLLAALCYIGFAFLKIDIPVGPEKTAFHFGNVFCVLASLLIGGYWGGLAGAIGMTIGDLTTSYVTSAPKTFLLKLSIGLIVGFVAHKIFKLNKEHSAKYITCVTILSSSCGMAFNMLADPIVGYFYKTYLLGVPQDISKALAKIAALTTGVNAVIAVAAASALYIALRPALKKSGLLVSPSPAKDTVRDNCKGETSGEDACTGKIVQEENSPAEIAQNEH